MRFGFCARYGSAYGAFRGGAYPPRAAVQRRSFPGRCVVWVHGTRLVVGLDNLARQLTAAENDAWVSWFASQVIVAALPASLTADGLY